MTKQRYHPSNKYLNELVNEGKIEQAFNSIKYLLHSYLKAEIFSNKLSPSKREDALESIDSMAWIAFSEMVRTFKNKEEGEVDFAQLGYFQCKLQFHRFMLENRDALPKRFNLITKLRQIASKHGLDKTTQLDEIVRLYNRDSNSPNISRETAFVCLNKASVASLNDPAFKSDDSDELINYISDESTVDVDPLLRAKLAIELERLKKWNARNYKMFERRVNGESLTEISKDYGISRERVRQIVTEMKTKLHKRLGLEHDEAKT